MKSLLLGIVFIILAGIGGLVYRNAVEYPVQPIACPVDTLVCPDGTAVSRTGSTCAFKECPPPNVVLADVGITFALPPGFGSVTPTEGAFARYEYTATSSVHAAAQQAAITIRRYPITASSTALATIQETAIGGASGLPASVTAFSSSVFGAHRFTIVSLERFEGVIDTAYYLTRGNDVLRFDAIDTGVTSWTDPSLDVSVLPAHQALTKLLSTLQGQ